MSKACNKKDESLSFWQKLADERSEEICRLTALLKDKSEPEPTKLNYCKEHRTIHCSCQQKEIDRLAAENKVLKEFACSIIKEVCWDIGGTRLRELDSGDVHAFAERLGLIIPHIATETDLYEDSDFEVGDTIYRFSEILERVTDGGIEAANH